ncbi:MULTISPECIES: cell division site-positioning protein MapZ family protein [Aerococcus]|uniref:cell division site-positioning protein MapZ family protein n=1 Tax=Aerococcus TaxID=1375 RepID=UPI000DCCD495|nr:MULTISPECIES: cell division site-positioning protein MapZ family protein [Aerococcus]KAA9299083.1 hypothetical protein F6I08_03240 [Aerococcus tenax]MDK6688251.1 cell division site-positioning protein MapZ family protein [Aerococcus urinae]MDK8132629.1 cell division site-positioning protein MapZ family protein [Aerococcus urinae]MDK8484451.1 cell division site-positioning protein MapZ family protein [Aerococcus urinae]MDL5179266.1 cell division site-positioning protein MapZ family protein [
MKKRLNWKAVIVALLSVVVVLGGGVYAVMQNQDIKQEKSDGSVEAAEKAVSALYYDDHKTFLKENIAKTEIEAVRSQVEGLNRYSGARKDLNKQLDQVEERFKAQEGVNHLFEKIKDRPALDGATVQKYVLLNKDLKEDDLNQFKEDQVKHWPSEADEFYQTLNGLVDQADKQGQRFKAFDEEIQKLKDNPGLTYDQLDQAMEDMEKKIEKEDNPYLKAELLDRLGKAHQEVIDVIRNRKLQAANDAKASSEEKEKIEAEAKREESRVEEENKNLQAESQRLRQAADQANAQHEQQSRQNRPARQVQEPREEQPANNQSQAQSQTQASTSQGQSSSQPASSSQTSQSSQADKPQEASQNSQTGSENSQTNTPSTSQPAPQPEGQPNQPSVDPSPQPSGGEQGSHPGESGVAESTAPTTTENGAANGQ